MATSRNLAIRMGHLLLVLALLIGSGLALSGRAAYAGNTDTPLQKVQTYGQCTDGTAYQVKVAGVGMRTQSSGTINLSLPATATVVKAWLYWNGDDPSPGNGGGGGTIKFETEVFSLGDGFTQQTGGPAFWTTNRFAYAYKADVTSLVSPSKSSYTFEDPFAGDPNAFDIPNGAALVVIYQDSAVTTPTIVETWEGMDIAQGSSSPSGSEGISPIRFDFDPAALDRTLHLTTIVGGIGSGEAAQVYYLTGNGTPPSGDIYGESGVIVRTLPAEEDGARMTTYDDTITVPAGDEWVIVQVRSPDSGGAQLQWLAETFQMVAACPNVQVTKTLVSPASGLAHVGDTITFQIAITNTGNTRLDQVPLADTFDSTYLTFSSASLTPDSTGSGTLTWNDVTTALGDINPGNSVTITVNFTAAAGTQSEPGDVTTNTATVSGAQDQNNNTAPDDSDSASVEISNPSLDVEKERITPAPPDHYVIIGETVAYTITIRNTGDTALNTVTVTDTFETTYLDYDSATPTPDTVDESNGKLIWNDLTGGGSLAPGASTVITVTFKATATTGGQKTHNRADVVGVDENNETVGPEEDTAFVRITNPAVTVDKELVGSSPVLVGDSVQFTIVITNTGDTTIDVLPLSDTYDSSKLQFVSASPSPDSAGSGTLSWNDLTGTGSLAVGASTTVVVTFTALASTTPGTTTDTATVSGAQDEHGSTVPTGSDTADVQILTPASIGNYVWHDQDGDGIQDAGEPGLQGVTVELYDSSDTLQDTTTTNASGLYTFTHLFPGNYYVQFIKPAGYEFTAQDQGTDDAKDSDADQSTGKTAVTSLSEGESDMTWDAGLYQPATIGDFAWVDSNGNGEQDFGESGLANVQISLYDDQGSFITSTTTNASGIYTFTNLAPGTYTVTAITPPGYVATTPTSVQRTVQSGDAVTDADFGFISPTAVMLVAFQAHLRDGGVVITWSTAWEEGVAGYRLQRATSFFGPWSDVTDAPIPAQGTDGDGATYQVVDTDVQPGFTYYYRLVTVPDGVIFGPWQVYVPKSSGPGGAEGGHRVFIPFISR